MNRRVAAPPLRRTQQTLAAVARHGYFRLVMPLRVLINDRALHRRKTGVGHYISELLTGMPSADAGVCYCPFYRLLPVPRRRVRPVRPPSPAGPPKRWPSGLRELGVSTYDLALRCYGQVRRCDLYHEPNHIPMAWPGPIVTTVHDLSVLRHPQWHPADRVRWYERDFFSSLPRTHRFVTVSAFTKQEITELAGIAPDRIDVIPLAPRTTFRPLTTSQWRSELSTMGFASEYVLFVGTLEPRKNLPTVLDTYARLPSRLRAKHPLYIAGVAGWGDNRISKRIDALGIRSQVRLLGYVDECLLPSLYNGASALLWPALYEGFGLPPLEAMACGTPVVTSNCASIPEVTGDAAALADPMDVDALSSLLERVLSDADYAASMIARGMERARQFSWQQCAGAHAATYRRVSAVS